MDLKEVERVVGSIQSELFKNSNSFSVGMLKSHFKGAGLQFKEHQIYNPGDDVRFIDWKLSAKTNTTFVKTFEEERNVEIHVMLDLSDSMLIGYKNVSKLQAAIEIICLLYLLAEKSKDKVSVILVEKDPITLPLSSGHAGIVHLISKLQKLDVLNYNGKVNILRRFGVCNEKKKMGLLKSMVARKKEVIILSDLVAYEDKELLNKLLYHPTLHCFVIQSPIDVMSKMPFAIYTKEREKSKVMRAFKRSEMNELKGRYRSLNVKDRYLESFVREML